MKTYSLIGGSLLAFNTACTVTSPASVSLSDERRTVAVADQDHARQTTVLALKTYASAHTGVSRAPLWSAEPCSTKPDK
jgi:hypothetical protein